MTKPNADKGPSAAVFPALAWFLAALAGATAVWVLLTTIHFARVGWAPVPVGDDWDRWITYVNHTRLDWFFMLHADHRLVAPKALFEIDHYFFEARGWFLLVCSFCLQALTATMLWRLSDRVCPQDRTERLILAAVMVACLFSGQQWVNFVWPFQVQFPLLYCAVTAALLTLGNAAAGSVLWLSATIIAATIATYSMANGVLLWPVLLLAASWLRMSRRSIAVLAGGAVFLGAPFFYHWHRAIAPVQLPTAERIPRTALFLLLHLGSPLAAPAILFDNEKTRLTTAAITGALLGLVVLAGFVMLWRRRERFSNARALLIFYCVFMVGSSASMAYGRSDGPLTEAFTPRYMTPSYILWSCLLLASWPLLRQLQRTALYLAISAALYVGIAMHQHTILYTVLDWGPRTLLFETAVVNDVVDTSVWKSLYGTPAITVDARTYLSANHLSLFSKEWTHWPGASLARRFFIDRNPDACQGQFEEAVVAPSTTLKPGWRTTGWAWDVKAGRPPRYVVLADSTGRVAGVAVTGFPEPSDVADLSPQYLGSPWNGYVSGPPRTITAYAVEADERSLCAIGTQRLPRVSREVNFTELGPPLPDANPEIAGAFTPNGYYQGHGGPGAPPVTGLIFGSYPDALVGTIRLGPFHLDGHTEIAIPLVTGPDNQNLSIVIRDAASKEVLSSLTPPPIHVSWWAWRPDLPTGREMTVEVFAEDKGSSWGQWMALGWPHLLKNP